MFQFKNHINPEAIVTQVEAVQSRLVHPCSVCGSSSEPGPNKDVWKGKYVNQIKYGS